MSENCCIFQLYTLLAFLVHRKMDDWQFYDSTEIQKMSPNIVMSFDCVMKPYPSGKERWSEIKKEIKMHDFKSNFMLTQ
jgi:hypothetical protein